MFKLIRKVVVYFDPLLENESLNLKKEFEAWDKHARTIQIRILSLLTGLLYIAASYIERDILSSDTLSFATSLHLYFLPPLLFFISAMTFFRTLYTPMILILAISPVLANIGNLYLTELLRSSPIYLSELYSTEVYLIVIWIFAISGLRFSYAIISASICFILTLGYQFYSLMPKEIFYLHQLWMFSAFSFGVMTALILEKNNKRIFLDARKLEQLATVDKLSGLYNRMKIETYCDMEIDRAERYNEIFSMILIDIDYFKEINDAHGHNIGDRVISNISKVLQSSIRCVDYVGRWGGEEFLILLPKTTAQQAFQIAEKIRITIMEEDFSPAQNITISAGITEYIQGDTTEKIIQRADDELYKAKESGRNQIQIYEAPSFF
ncbi:GGDEF domain-containing protein [Sulfuricurvum sp.]|uniref:GGDEF domain-containing protein n=1 Tax=Sulfuricurvum sp. TaxID=2025608 RepID=UPI00286DFF9C|nr:GGDEF domain-containing protein [Sulfuricurvum sp.]